MYLSAAVNAMNRYGHDEPRSIVVDYALYSLSVMLARLGMGYTYSKASYRALCFTGKVVLITALQPSADANAPVQLSGETA
jgi:hypothetical protein